jgi:protein tyrosine/serine phosphatase
VTSWLNRARIKKAVILSSALLSILGGLWLYGNFHTVREGLIFRSAQLPPVSLWFYTRLFHIRSVINLQGADPKSYWYRAELRTAGQLGIQHIDYRLSALREVSVPEADDLLRTIDRAPKPVLLHCAGGADRSGLVSALWLYARERLPAKEAAKQLSIYYGHIPALSAGTAAMDKSYWEYVAATEATPVSSTPQLDDSVRTLPPSQSALAIRHP